MLDVFDVGVLLVPFEVGPAVLLLAVGFIVLIVFAVDVVVESGLVLGATVDVDDVLFLVVGVVGEAVALVVGLIVVVLETPLPVTVSVSGLNIIHSELTAN